MSFGTDVPSVGGLRSDWSNVVVDSVIANETGNSRLPFADQSGRDLRGRCAGQLPRDAGRRRGRSRSSARAAPRYRRRATTSATRSSTEQLFQHPRQHQEGATVQHVRRQSGGPLPVLNGKKNPSSSIPSRRRWSHGRTVRNWTMPTALERQATADTDTSGRLVFHQILSSRHRAGLQHGDGRSRDASPATSSRPIASIQRGPAHILPMPDNFDRAKTLRNTTTQHSRTTTTPR
jgi:hypothetical protein